MPEAEKGTEAVCPKCGHNLLCSPAIGTYLSPAPAITYTNHTPSELESRLIKANLAEIDVKTRRLDSDINRVQTLLASLVETKERLREHSSSQKTSLSLFRRFPPEVLAEVFRQYDRPRFRRAYPPAQVCRFWRDVAFSTTFLWTSLKFDLKKVEGETDLKMVQRWLSSSGGLPLTISLGEHAGVTDRPACPSIELIASHSYRWKNVKIYLQEEILRDIRRVQDNLPLLESLELLIYYHTNDDLPPNDLFLAAPRLRELELFRNTSKEIPQVNWTQLTVCRLGGEYLLTELYDIIQGCDNLSQCTLEVSCEPNAEITHRPIIIRPNIESLAMFAEDTFEGTHLGSLLDRLELPSMSSYSQDLGNTNITSLTSLLSRSVPPLRQLYLQSWNGDPTTEVELIDCLQSCPLLQNLTLLTDIAGGVNARFLRRLTHFPGHSSCCLVPKLQSFSVAVRDCFNLEAFAAMVESRWRNHECACRAMDHQQVERISRTMLQQVDLDSAEDATGHDTPWARSLYQMVAEGLLLQTESEIGDVVSLDQILRADQRSEYDGF